MHIDCLKKEYLQDIALIERENFSQPWSYCAFENELKNEIAHYFIAVDTNVLGYGGVHIVLDEAYITNIAVKLPFRRRKIGQSILKSILDFCILKKCSFVSLEVREGNAAAVKLYEKMGFKTVGMRKNFYSIPTENALIMTFYIN